MCVQPGPAQWRAWAGEVVLLLVLLGAGCGRCVPWRGPILGVGVGVGVGRCPGSCGPRADGGVACVSVCVLGRRGWLGGCVCVCGRWLCRVGRAGALASVWGASGWAALHAAVAAGPWVAWGVGGVWEGKLGRPEQVGRAAGGRASRPGAGCVPGFRGGRVCGVGLGGRGGGQAARKRRARARAGGKSLQHPVFPGGLPSKY